MEIIHQRKTKLLNDQKNFIFNEKLHKRQTFTPQP